MSIWTDWHKAYGKKLKKREKKLKRKLEIPVYTYPGQRGAGGTKRVKAEGNGFKPVSSSGYRGFPRTFKDRHMTSAPSRDQRRTLERAYMTRLHTKDGLLYFKYDGVLFSHEEAKKRRYNTMADMHTNLLIDARLEMDEDVFEKVTIDQNEPYQELYHYKK